MISSHIGSFPLFLQNGFQDNPLIWRPEILFSLTKALFFPKDFIFQIYFIVQSGLRGKDPSSCGISSSFNYIFYCHFHIPYTASAGITSPPGLTASFYKAQDNQFSCTEEDRTQSKTIQTPKAFEMKWYPRCQASEGSTKLGMKGHLKMPIL